MENLPPDNPTIGLILCSQKNEAIARYSVLADDQQLFASKYQMILPTEEELAQVLNEEFRMPSQRTTPTQAINHPCKSV